jgi:signal transduction histidine kinase
MKLAIRLTIFLLLAVAVLLGAQSVLQVRRESRLFEEDIAHDDRLMGKWLSSALARVWELQGEAAALEFLQAADRASSDVRIRLVRSDDFASLSGFAPADQLAKLLQGEEQVVRIVDEKGDPAMATYVLVGPPGSPRGALQLTESLKFYTAYTRSTIVRQGVIMVVIAVAFAGLAMALGYAYIGKPVQRMVARSALIGKGELGERLRITNRAELSELADAIDSMADQLEQSRLLIARETTSKLEALEQLRRAERLATLGTLASGIAHELGTPLNVIQARAAMITEPGLNAGEAEAHARIIVGQSERMTRIVRELLDFARPRSPERTNFEVGALARSTLEMLTPLASRAGVTLNLECPRPLHVLADAPQMQQVLSNLVMNAVQASARHQQVLVIVDQCDTPRGMNAPSPVVRVRVIDRGPGVPPEHAQRVFEPFFTTKSPGEGTGLGLSISRGIIEENGGRIELQAPIEGGSCFVCYIPGSEP